MFPRGILTALDTALVVPLRQVPLGVYWIERPGRLYPTMPEVWPPTTTTTHPTPPISRGQEVRNAWSPVSGLGSEQTSHHSVGPHHEWGHGEPQGPKPHSVQVAFPRRPQTAKKTVSQVSQPGNEEGCIHGFSLGRREVGESWRHSAEFWAVRKSGP